MDAITVLNIVLIVAVLVLIAAGVYLIVLINEASQTLKNINKLLDRTNGIIGFLEDKIIRPASSLGTVTGLIREIINLFQDLKSAVTKPEKESKHDR